jgi:hypothetical protein
MGFEDSPTGLFQGPGGGGNSGDEMHECESWALS